MAIGPSLLLFSRQGCCLCEGLEERLRSLPLLPPLTVVDVDRDPALRARYDLSVPVLALAGSGDAGWRDLPRVPPRLSGERLLDWLRREGVHLPSGNGDGADPGSRHSGDGAPAGSN